MRRTTNHEELTLTNFPMRGDVQWMKHMLSRLNTKHVEDAQVVLKYREVIDQALDDQMHHVPLESKLCSTRVWWVVIHRRWKLEVRSWAVKQVPRCQHKVPAQETPAPAPTSTVVFNVTVRESVVAGQNPQVPRSRKA